MTLFSDEHIDNVAILTAWPTEIACSNDVFKSSDNNLICIFIRRIFFRSVREFRCLLFHWNPFWGEIDLFFSWCDGDGEWANGNALNTRGWFNLVGKTGSAYVKIGHNQIAHVHFDLSTAVHITCIFNGNSTPLFVPVGGTKSNCI